MERSNFLSTCLEGQTIIIVTDGIDLARNVFAVHGVDESGKPVLVRPEAARAKLLELIVHCSAISLSDKVHRGGNDNDCIFD